jgi:hypothetical protein
VRKLVASFFISLDGVVDSPQDWHFPYMDDEIAGAIGAGMRAETIVLGRRTYEEWAAFWPHQPSDGGMADYINKTPKLVASTTLDRLEWQGSSLIDAAAPDSPHRRRAGQAPVRGRRRAEGHATRRIPDLRKRRPQRDLSTRGAKLTVPWRRTATPPARAPAPGSAGGRRASGTSSSPGRYRSQARTAGRAPRPRAPARQPPALRPQT